MIEFSGHLSGIYRESAQVPGRKQPRFVSRIAGSIKDKLKLSAQIALAISGLLLYSTGYAQIDVFGDSVSTSLDCTSNPCPWGTTINRQAVVWPNTVTTVSNRLGYTTSQPVYLTAEHANQATVTIVSGEATVRAGNPDADFHTTLAYLFSGESYSVSGLAADEVILISSTTSFSYEVVIAQATNPAPTDPAPTDPPPTDPTPTTGTSSEYVTLNCTSSPCPWGAAPGGNALVWPDTANALTNRLGYTATRGIYLESAQANGSTITVQTGSATLNAGNPDDTSFRSLGSLSDGQSMTVSGLLDGEVLVLINSGAAFTYDAVLADTTTPTNPTPTDPTPTDPTPTDPPATGLLSEFVTLTCDGDRCPWGSTPGAHAVVWPATSKPLDIRLDYTASQGIYLPKAYAAGATITINSGSVTLKAGYGNSSTWRTLKTVNTGETYSIPALNSGEVVQATSTYSFSYDLSLPATPPAPVGDVYSSVPTYWRCTTVDCTGADWVANAVAWPSWSAYSDNDRTGDNLRTTFGSDGGMINIYMGSWANGCEVSVVDGVAVVIEWERGTDVWRKTPIGPGETHTISLLAPENGALMESWGPFTVAVDNCAPQALP